MSSSGRIVFVIDEDVPLSVAKFFRNRGHEVHLVKQSTFEGEPGEIIVKLADRISRESGKGVVLVTWNHRHFARLISRRPQLNNLRYRVLGRLSFLCSRAVALKRLNETIDDIEREYQLCQTRNDKRLIMTIDELRFSIER